MQQFSGLEPKNEAHYQMLIQRVAGGCCLLCSAAICIALAKPPNDANFYQMPSIGSFLICIYIGTAYVCNHSLVGLRDKGH